jgi:hypothetical protein
MHAEAKMALDVAREVKHKRARQVYRGVTVALASQPSESWASAFPGFRRVIGQPEKHVGDEYDTKGRTFKQARDGRAIKEEFVREDDECVGLVRAALYLLWSVLSVDRRL